MIDAIFDYICRNALLVAIAIDQLINQLIILYEIESLSDKVNKNE